MAIHDGVRPFVAKEVIGRCFDAARRGGAAIPVLPVTDTLRYCAPGEEQRNVLRSDYRIVQTPQVFATSTWLKKLSVRTTARVSPTMRRSWRASERAWRWWTATARTSS